jgi:hypothetical protein
VSACVCFRFMVREEKAIVFGHLSIKKMLQREERGREKKEKEDEPMQPVRSRHIAFGVRDFPVRSCDTQRVQPENGNHPRRLSSVQAKQNNQQLSRIRKRMACSAHGRNVCSPTKRGCTDASDVGRRAVVRRECDRSRCVTRVPGQHSSEQGFGYHQDRPRIHAPGK